MGYVALTIIYVLPLMMVVGFFSFLKVKKSEKLLEENGKYMNWIWAFLFALPPIINWIPVYLIGKDVREHIKSEKQKRKREETLYLSSMDTFECLTEECKEIIQYTGRQYKYRNVHKYANKNIEKAVVRYILEEYANVFKKTMAFVATMEKMEPEEKNKVIEARLELVDRFIEDIQEIEKAEKELRALSDKKTVNQLLEETEKEKKRFKKGKIKNLSKKIS